MANPPGNGKFIKNALCFAVVAVALYLQWPQIYKGILRIRKLTETRNELNARIGEERKKLAARQTEVSRLNEAYYREKLARDKLQMIKRGEIVYKLVENPEK